MFQSLPHLLTQGFPLMKNTSHWVSVTRRRAPEAPPPLPPFFFIRSCVSTNPKVCAKPKQDAKMAMKNMITESFKLRIAIVLCQNFTNITSIQRKTAMATQL